MMRRFPIAPGRGFQVLGGSPRSQAATMVLAPGEQTGGADNRHSADQLGLYVLEGEGRARVADQELTLRPGDLLLIEAGEAHQIAGAGGQPLKTLDIYAPPAY